TVCQRKWNHDSRQNTGKPRLSDQRHLFRRCGRSERVMKIPKWMLQRLREIIRCSAAGFAGGAPQMRPIARQDCQRSEPALWMIYWTRAAQPPGIGWQDESLQRIAVRPPAVP